MTIEARFSGHLGAFEVAVDLQVPSRGVTALFGRSGCGKTTVLRFMAGLNRFDNGFLSVDGEVWQADGANRPTHQRAIGYVFQEASLFPHLDVTGNLTFGARRAASSDRKGGPAVSFEDVVGMLGLEGLLSRPVAALSGGERQRVAIGRALLARPRLLLMDEPLSALDRFAKDDILPYLVRLHDDLAIPMLYVTHDIAEVERLADYLVLMEAGRVRKAGPLGTVLSDPDLPFARSGEAAVVFEGLVTDRDADYGLLRIEAGGAVLQVPDDSRRPGDIIRLRVRASDVALARGRAPQGSTIL
ncbi:MAG: molybdenum ABC transporter ATP-binding protein, partial [Rhodospirillales bacterium]